MIPAVLSLLVNLLGNAVSLFDHQQSGERWTKSTQTTILFKNQNSLTVYPIVSISNHPIELPFLQFAIRARRAAKKSSTDPSIGSGFFGTMCAWVAEI